MAQNLKVLGQIRPAANTLTPLYTVPNSVIGTAVSCLKVINTSAFNDVFRVSVAIGGAIDALSQYIYYDVNVNANDSFDAVEGLTLAPGDVVRCQSKSGNINFHLYGVENS